MIYALIDTNIWIRLLSQGRPGCEPEYFDELCKAVDAQTLTIILPEVIRLELEGSWRDFRDEVSKHFIRLESSIEGVFKQKLWTEIEDVQGAISGFLKERQLAKIKSAEGSYHRIQELFASARMLTIALTSDLLFLARKRLMAKRMPRSENRTLNDACIIESLKEAFRAGRGKDDEIYFCSENTDDFALPVKDQYILHPVLNEELPPSQYFTTLRDLIAFHSSNAKVEALPPEVVEAALQEEIKSLATSDLCVTCAKEGRRESPIFVGSLCFAHFRKRYESLQPRDREEVDLILKSVLNSVSYRDREVFKLRTGLFGDGYSYTALECAHIFRCSVATVQRAEERVIRRLRTSSYASRLASFF